MNTTTAIDELITDLEDGIQILKKNDEFYQSEGLTQSQVKYKWLFNAYNDALNTANQLKDQLDKIQRGF